VTTQKEIAQRLGIISADQLRSVLAGKSRVGKDKALALQKITGIGVLVWLYATPGEIKSAIEEWLGEPITDGRGYSATGRPLTPCKGGGCLIKDTCKRNAYKPGSRIFLKPKYDAYATRPCRNYVATTVDPVIKEDNK
jgi:transcriptional regulator with XRE-family HTH domain